MMVQFWVKTVAAYFNRREHIYISKGLLKKVYNSMRDIRIRTMIKIILKAEYTLNRSTLKKRHNKVKTSNPSIPAIIIGLGTASGKHWITKNTIDPMIKANIADIFNPSITALCFM